MIAGFLIIFLFPFAFLFTQLNNMNTKTEAIKKAMAEGKETYFDPIDCCERWLETGEKIIRCKWGYNDNNNAVKNDSVLLGVKTNRIYKNYTKERFLAHIQKQKDEGKCWCIERHKFADGKTGDIATKYNFKEKYFYFLTWDSTYFLKKIKDNVIYERIPISFERYKELGGVDPEWLHK